MHKIGYDVFSIPRLHYGEQRRLAEGQALLDERERDRQIQARGGDAEDLKRRERAKEHHAQTVAENREQLRAKWGAGDSGVP